MLSPDRQSRMAAIGFSPKKRNATPPSSTRPDYDAFLGTPTEQTSLLPTTRTSATRTSVTSIPSVTSPFLPTIPTNQLYSAVPAYRKLNSLADTLPPSPNPNTRSPLPPSHPSSKNCLPPTILSQLPAVAIVCLLNLMLSVPFGSAFFPPMSPSTCAPPVPLLGVRLFLLSTMLGQLFLGSQKLGGTSFWSAGMMMVENIPFMHSLAFEIHDQLSSCNAQFIPTVLASFHLTTILTTLSFYLISMFKLGNVVFFFPKHVILGCVGGIGVFVVKTGLEVSTSGAMTLSSATSIVEFFTYERNPGLYLLPLLLSFGLRLFQKLLPVINTALPWLPASTASLLPPLFFLSLTPLFYLTTKSLGLSPPPCYFFPTTSTVDAAPSPLYPTYGLSLLNFPALLATIPTQISCVIFSLMHAPINIPSMSISTGVDVDMNAELRTHYLSNLFASLSFCPPNYMCYSNSIVYHRAGGRGELSSLLIVLSTSLLFFFGNSLIKYIPRLMAGTLLIHVGLDLFLEGLYDSYYAGFDALEYGSIVVIIVTMSMSGMTTGLIVGIICAALTFVVNTSPRHTNPIRGTMPATTFVSSRWRTVAARTVLDGGTGRRQIMCVQLQGHLYFANLEGFTQAVKAAVTKREGTVAVRYVILDFTLVLGLDTSAALAIVKLASSLLSRYGVESVAFVTGKEDGGGFPTNLGLTEQLSSMSGCCVMDSLDEGLGFLEDVILAKVKPGWEKETFFKEIGGVDEGTRVKAILGELCKVKGGDRERLLKFFQRIEVSAGTVMWRQGDLGDRFILLVKGEMKSCLEEEAGTEERVKEGHFIGELALIMGDEGRRLTTVTSETACVVYEMSRRVWEEMKEAEPKFAVLVMTCACRYLQHRVQHVSNRFVETKCIPI